MIEPEEKQQDDEKEEPAEKPEAKPEPKVKEDDDGNVTVDLGTRPERRAPRKQRREESFEELRRFRDENEGLRARMAAMEAQMHARLQGVEQRIPADDPYEKQLGQIRNQQETIQTTLRSGAVQSPQDVERLRQQFYDLDGQARRLDRDRIKNEVAQEIRRESQPQAGAYEEAALRNEYPDVINHPQAIRYATGLYYTLVAEGKPQTLQTSREAMDKAAARFNLRAPPVPTPSPSQQQRFGAVSAQAGAKSTGEVRLDSAQRKMALARWPQVDEHVAYTRMAALLHKAEADGERQE